MEKQIDFCGVEINLSKNPQYTNIDYRVDYLVVGCNEQKRLKNEQINYVFTERLSRSDTNNVYVKTNQIPSKMSMTHCQVIRAVEPFVTIANYAENDSSLLDKKPFYSKLRSSRGDTNKSFCFEFYGNDAIESAKKDLAALYRNTLRECSKTDKKTRIAFAIFPTGKGFKRKESAPVIVQTILNWLQKNPTAYSTIHLLVKTETEFNLYEKLIVEHVENYKSTMPAKTVS